jgi:hypothetical protein
MAGERSLGDVLAAAGGGVPGLLGLLPARFGPARPDPGQPPASRSGAGSPGGGA